MHIEQLSAVDRCGPQDLGRREHMGTQAELGALVGVQVTQQVGAVAHGHACGLRDLDGLKPLGGWKGGGA